MGQYFSDIVNEEADDQLEMDIIYTVPGRYGDSYVCRVSDGDKDVGFILQSRAMKYVFVSEGELTVNFVKLLARLFKKDFEVKEVVERLVVTVDGILDKEDNVIRMKCSTGKQISDSKYLEYQNALFKELEEMKSLNNLSEEEMKKVSLRKILDSSMMLTQQTNYAEFYLHLNLKEKRIVFLQKNPGFQLPILRLLTNTPSPL